MLGEKALALVRIHDSKVLVVTHVPVLPEGATVARQIVRAQLSHPRFEP